MKKAVFVILLIVFVLTTFAACTASVPGQSAAGEPSAQKETAAPEAKVTPVPETEAPIVETEEPTEEPAKSEQTEAPHKAGEIEVDDTLVEAFITQYRSAAPDTDTPLESIPVFFESDLLYSPSSRSPLNFARNGGGDMPESLSIFSIEIFYPSFACRKCSDSKYYIVYDTETGYRLFVYSRELNINAGFSVLLKHGAELLSYDDFKGLAIGDPVDAVCEVDPVAECYKEHFKWYDPEHFTDPVKSFNESDFPASIHYLSDGILEIDYEMTESGEIRIRNMIYNEDRILPDEDGRPLDYTICSVDLP